tara:strand:+ start:748 stop:1338 length:591 start_codon:yes stop_codon:yes gene_type:complete
MSKKDKFLKTFKKRYNVELYNFVYVLKDLNESDDYNTPDCLVHKWGIVPKDDVTKHGRYVGRVNLNEDTDGVSSIYKQTDSGFNSHRHEINKDTSTQNLIPMVFIDRDDFCLSFRLDNPFIREMFYDTELVLGKDEINNEDSFNHRHQEHIEYLDYFMNGNGSKWIEIYFEKCDNGKKNLLHREYLKTKVKELMKK